MADICWSCQVKVRFQSLRCCFVSFRVPVLFPKTDDPMAIDRETHKLIFFCFLYTPHPQTPIIDYDLKTHPPTHHGNAHFLKRSLHTHAHLPTYLPTSPSDFAFCVSCSSYSFLPFLSSLLLLLLIKWYILGPLTDYQPTKHTQILTVHCSHHYHHQDGALLSSLTYKQNQNFIINYLNWNNLKQRFLPKFKKWVAWFPMELPCKCFALFIWKHKIELDKNERKKERPVARLETQNMEWKKKEKLRL